jgi:phytol kinase
MLELSLMIVSILSLVNWQLILVFFVIFLIFLSSEYLVHRRITRGELSRKYIHVLIGITLAASCFILNINQIILACIILNLSLILADRMFAFLESRKFNSGSFGAHLKGAFRVYDESQEGVKRWTIGHLIYAIGIALVAIIFKSESLFFTTTLILALADGSAALVGKKYGVYLFRVPGGVKSIEGSVTFFLVTVMIVALYILVLNKGEFGEYASLALGYKLAFNVVLVSGIITASEAIVAYGLDNVTIPLISGFLIHHLIT